MKSDNKFGGTTLFFRNVFSIVAFFALIFACFSCTQNPNFRVNTEYEYDHDVNINIHKITSDVSIFEVTIDGETHEYLKIYYGLSHWEGCKYCKQNKEE